jgi:hypothetical protein
MMDTQPDLRKSFVTVLVLIAVSMTATSASAETFKETYQAYQQAVAARDWPLALTTSERALDQGIDAFDRNGENVANLRLNYARQLIRNDLFVEAVKQLELCLKSKIANHGSKSSELIDTLMELGKASTHAAPADAGAYFSRAIKNSVATKNDMLTAKLKLDAGLILLKISENDSALKHLKEAHRFYTKKFGVEDIRGGMAGLGLGRVYFEAEKDKKALQVLNSTLLAFSATDRTTQQFNTATRKLLVNILEVMDRRDQATEHCLAIAMANATSDSADAQLIYKGRRFNPPMLGVRNTDGIDEAAYGGEVLVNFDVDEKGFVVNPTVIESSTASAEATAIKEVKTQRYSPRISKGKAVMAHDLEYRYSKESNLKFGG